MDSKTLRLKLLARGTTIGDKLKLFLYLCARYRPGFWVLMQGWCGEADWCVTVNTTCGPARLVFNPLHTSELTVVDELLPGDIYTVSRGTGGFVDCGAFRGISTIYLQDQAKALRVVAFEPQHENFSVLKRRLAKYYPDAVCVNAAVGAANASVLFEGGGVGGSVGAEGRPVRMERLRDRLTGGDAEGLLLKMDIEGAEREVLPDLLPVLPHECSIFLETHFPPGPSEALVGLFREAGFAVKECRRRKESNSDVLFIDWTLHR